VGSGTVVGECGRLTSDIGLDGARSRSGGDSIGLAEGPVAVALITMSGATPDRAGMAGSTALSATALCSGLVGLVGLLLVEVGGVGVMMVA